MLLMASSAGWLIGIGVGIVVVTVAALIVLTIISLAVKISKQAAGAVEAVEVVRSNTEELPNIARINDSGVRILHAARALRKVAVGR